MLHTWLDLIYYKQQNNYKSLLFFSSIIYDNFNKIITIMLLCFYYIFNNYNVAILKLSLKYSIIIALLHYCISLFVSFISVDHSEEVYSNNRKHWGVEQECN